jgi:hypothetical protein
MDEQARTLDALANKRRLLVLLSLKENETPMTLNELATDVAMNETDFPDEELATEHIDSVLVSLHHVHLPKLTAEGIVSFDEREDSVALADDLGDVGHLLNAIFSD